MKTRKIDNQEDVLAFLSDLQDLINDYFWEMLKEKDKFHQRPNFGLAIEIKNGKFLLTCKDGCTLRIPDEAPEIFSVEDKTIEGAVKKLAEFFFIKSAVVYVEFQKSRIEISCVLLVENNEITPKHGIIKKKKILEED